MTEHAAPTGHELTDSELAVLHALDRQAARHIVLLLTSVFIVGVALYSFIAWVVATSTSYWVPGIPAGV
jgi:hypothetical protein